MRVSQAYNLNRNQSSLDFLDISLISDIPVYLDPSAIRSLVSPWGQELTATLNNFFGLVLSNIQKGQHDEARSLLASLSESNEYHLGVSVGRSRGHAFGEGSAEDVWSALTKNKSNIAKLLNNIEDSILLVPGVGPDMVSDALCNILRGPFIRFTQEACAYYGIPLTHNVASGPIWNVKAEKWDAGLVTLPCHDQFGKFILVPKNLVRHKISCDAHSYYRHHLLPMMQRHEIKTGSSLVRYRKDETPFVTKKSLMDKYGADKLSIIEQTQKFPNALEKYKTFIEQHPTPPLSHNQVSSLVKETSTDWDKFIVELRALRAGSTHASAYEDLIERIFTSLFYPSLCNPTKQATIHEGRKRLDLRYTNESQSGFFYWIKDQLPSLFIAVECKNYSGDVANPEVDQLAGRFSPSRGKVGILVYRKVQNKGALDARCKDTALDGRGWIVNLDDDDVIALIEEKKREENVESLQSPTAEDYKSSKYSVLRQKMTALVD